MVHNLLFYKLKKISINIFLNDHFVIIYPIYMILESNFFLSLNFCRRFLMFFASDKFNLLNFPLLKFYLCRIIYYKLNINIYMDFVKKNVKICL